MANFLRIVHIEYFSIEIVTTLQCKQISVIVNAERDDIFFPSQNGSSLALTKLGWQNMAPL